MRMCIDEFLYEFFAFVDVHCAPIVWNPLNSASILLCLNGANFPNIYSSLVLKHGNMFIYKKHIFYVVKIWSG